MSSTADASCGGVGGRAGGPSRAGAACRDGAMNDDTGNREGESAQSVPGKAVSTGGSVGLPIGAAVGLALGLTVFDNIGVGLALGIPLGFAAGVGMAKAERAEGSAD